MARDKIFDPAFQKAFTEAIFKEKKLKAKWYLEHGSTLHRVPDTCLWDDEPDDDEYVQPSTSTCLDEHPPKEPRKQEEEDAVHARELGTKQETDEEEKKTHPMQIMKPVPIRTKKLLYKDYIRPDPSIRTEVTAFKQLKYSRNLTHFPPHVVQMSEGGSGLISNLFDEAYLNPQEGLSHDEEGKEKYLRKRKSLDPEEKYHFPVCSSWDYGWTYGLDYTLKCPDYGRREIIKTSFFRPNDPQLKPRQR